MSFFAKMGEILSGKKGGGSRASHLYIVDAGGIAKSRRGGERLSPRDQLDILHPLARFAEKEKLKLCAVFDGRSMRKVGNGETYNGVTVYFTEGQKKLDDCILGLLRDGRKRHDVMVITGNQQLEKRVAGSGGSTIRISTLKRALETSDEGGNGQSRSRSLRRRPRRSAQQRPAPNREASPAKAKDEDGDLHQLIDLVE